MLINFVSGDQIQIFLDQKELIKMSLQSVSDLSNKMERIVDVDKNLWFKRSHVGKYLGIRNIRDNYRDFLSHFTRLKYLIRGLNECEMSTINAINPGRKDEKIEWDIFFYQGEVFCM